MSERMTPAQEALCAVMEAWGARYSDSPVVLGLSPSRAGMAPKGALLQRELNVIITTDMQSFRQTAPCVLAILYT